MNRRGFFAAMMAPIVVPWRTCPGILESQVVKGWTLKYDASNKRIALQTKHNALMNQMVDNITLGSLPEQDFLDKLAESDLDDRSLWGPRLR